MHRPSCAVAATALLLLLAGCGGGQAPAATDRAVEDRAAELAAEAADEALPVEPEPSTPAPVPCDVPTVLLVEAPAPVCPDLPQELVLAGGQVAGPLTRAVVSAQGDQGEHCTGDRYGDLPQISLTGTVGAEQVTLSLRFGSLQDALTGEVVGVHEVTGSVLPEDDQASLVLGEDLEGRFVNAEGGSFTVAPDRTSGTVDLDLGADGRVTGAWRCA